MAYRCDYHYYSKGNKECTSSLKNACFSQVRHYNIPKNAYYFVYDFHNVSKDLNKIHLRKYFTFLKSIPLFKELFPMTVKELVDTKKYSLNMHKINGLKAFAGLTLVRAVVDDAQIVKAVCKFSPKFKYSVSNFNILKMCGSAYMHNSGHWLTGIINKNSITDDNIDVDYGWNDETKFKHTGIICQLNNTFQKWNDGWRSNNPVNIKMIEDIAKENKTYYNRNVKLKQAKKVVVKIVKKVETKTFKRNNFILDF